MVIYKHSYNPSYNLTTSPRDRPLTPGIKRDANGTSEIVRMCTAYMLEDYELTPNHSLTIYFDDVAATNPPNALPLGNYNPKRLPPIKYKTHSTKQRQRNSNSSTSHSATPISPLTSHIPDVRQNILRVSFESTNWNRPI